MLFRSITPLRPTARPQPLVEHRELSLDDIVVVIPPRIPRDPPAFDLRPSTFDPVIHRQHHHAPHSRKHAIRLRPPVRIPRQPLHLTRASVGEPRSKFRRMRRRNARRDPAEIKPERFRKGDEFSFHDATLPPERRARRLDDRIRRLAVSEPRRIDRELRRCVV